MFKRVRFVRLALLIAAAFLGAFGTTKRAQAQQTADVRILPVQGNVYMLVGAGNNITLQIGDEGVLLVDSGLPAMSDKIVAAIRQISKKPIRYVINTHVHPESTGGNEKISKAGQSIVAGNFAGQVGDAAANQAVIIAHENVLNRMSAPTGKEAPTPVGAWPTDTFFTKSKELFFDGEAIQILHQPAAHTDGDSIVFFRRSDVVSAGDLFLTTGYPVIDTKMGGRINGIIDALNRILDITIPRDKQEGGTYVIPGRGRLCDEADVLEYRDMLTIIRDRIQDMVKKGITLEQVKAAKPTLDYDPRYGTDSGPWTTSMFIEAVYQNLKTDVPATTKAQPPVKR